MYQYEIKLISPHPHWVTKQICSALRIPTEVIINTLAGNAPKHLNCKNLISTYFIIAGQKSSFIPEYIRENLSL